LWTVPVAGGAPAPIGCIDYKTGYVEARAIAGKQVYLAVYRSESKLNSIAKLTLP
jgi:hypothetical protein